MPSSLDTARHDGVLDRAGRDMTSSGTELSTQTPGSASASDQSMSDRAGQAAEQSKQAAGDLAQTAGQRAQDVKEEVARQARDLLGEARGHLTQQAGDQHRALVDNMRSLSSELGSMADRSDQQGLATELVSQARERIEGAAQWLDGRQPGDIVNEVRSFAQRRPGTFLLGALAAGLVAGRLTRGVVDSHTDDSSGGGVSASGSYGDPVNGQHYAFGPPADSPTAPLTTTADYGTGTYVAPNAGPQPEGAGYQPTTVHEAGSDHPYRRPGQFGEQGGLA